MDRKTRIKPRRRSRTTFWALILAVLGTFSLIWWVWPGLYCVSPRFDSLLLQKNGEPLRLLRGDTLHLHPHDRLRILSLSTNVSFNVGVRLFARGLDVESLRYDILPIGDLLERDTLSGERRFRVHVRHQNTDMGHIDLAVGPFVEDWLDKAERTIEPTKKAEILQEALKYAPQDRRIRSKLVEVYRSLRMWPEAAALLEAVAKEKPDQETLQSLLEVYEAMPQAEGVFSTFKRLLQLRPEDARTRLRYAAALEKAKKTQEAIRQYEEALSRLEKGERIDVYRTLGFLYAESGDIPKALLNYQRTLDLDKDDPNLYYNLSSLYEREGDEEKALFYLGEALRLKPEDADGHLRLAERLLRKGELDNAEKHLTAVLNRTPTSMEALLLMTRVAEKKKDQEKLKDLYARILSLDPDNETILYNLGIAEYEAGNLAKSLPLLQKYAQNHPEDADVRTLLFSIYRKEKKDDLAFQEAKWLLTGKPAEAALYHFVFEYLYSRGNYGAIIEIMKSGLHHLPENTDLRKYLVLAYLKDGKENLALAQMQEMLRLRPNDVALLLQFAKLQEKQGKSAEALEAYKKVLAVDPGHAEASEAYLRLRMRALPSNE